MKKKAFGGEETESEEKAEMKDLKRGGKREKRSKGRSSKRK